MIFETGTARLVSIREAFRGQVNDVLICTREGGAAGNYYTVWVMKEHSVGKAVLEAFCRSAADGQEGEAYLECFSQGAFLCLSFPFVQERPLERFYRKEAYDRESRKRILFTLAAACMKSGLPAPILYLILEQGQVQLMQDGGIRFRYVLDLSEFDEECGEQDCIEACADLACRMLEEEGKAGDVGRRLIERKLKRRAYSGMEELYRDLYVIMDRPGRKSLFHRWNTIQEKEKQRLFRLLAAISILLAATALIMAVSGIIFGGFPFLRIFEESFRTIGTESLLQ